MDILMNPVLQKYIAASWTRLENSPKKTLIIY